MHECIRWNNSDRLNNWKLVHVLYQRSAQHVKPSGCKAHPRTLPPVTDGSVSYRMIEIAKSMGLTLIRPARGKANTGELRDTNRYASLVLPLVKYEAFMEQRKRKKMH